MSWTVDSLTYTTRLKCTIDKTKIDADLIDFPVLVKLTSTNFDFAAANSDGHDIRFTSSDGTTLLKYERERHDSTNKLAEYWVKVPSVSDSADTYIYLYYRTEDTADGADPENVWDSNFKSVHHLKDNTTSAVLDSTANNNDGTKKEANKPYESLGKIAKGQQFISGGDNYINIKNVSLATHRITVEAWIKTPGHATMSPFIVAKVLSPYNPPYAEYVTYVNRQNGDFPGQVTFYLPTSGEITTVQTTNRVDDDEWHYVAMKYDGENIKVKRDDDAFNSVAASGNMSLDTEPTYIGYQSANPTQTFVGIIDEVRISNVARSDAWIKASYNSGNNSLLSIGADDEPSASVSPSFSPSISESSSISASLSESISPSLSESVSSSISPSISESSSISASISPSLSASISISISPSLSPSSSPSIGYQEYTKGDYVELPAGADDLTSSYTEQNYIDVSSINDVFVGQDTSYNYTIHQFKEYCGSSDICTLTCVCKTNFLPSLSPVYLQIYNRDTSSWETVATNNTANVNTSFTLSANIFGLSDYKDENTVISCRVYQQG